ncbi:transposon Tf2-1 polyprotein isoform X1 [Cucumis melo var. makuwa]|uniref:Transposon Tf2-1 polyprotein isoform X1 n=1 Tax=Cucumis melo var. makuwa TaxID=1194695 RepID=A0A5A7TP62_CUCMM|nr:transposon Tf2-1 polyprotein isoform X1 [Cucumis melo var. makuwa]TYK12263.1 transposon Tf2-1 polyprotein isoform X1 [Cucumis melo var. makuwa]
METTAKERSEMSERMTESTIHDSTSKKMKETKGLSSKASESERRERKTESDNGNNERNKFKKVEMLIFNEEDPDSWLFDADRYFQIHKLNDSEKMIVVMISFEGSTLNWYRSQEEHEKFTDWTNMKKRLLIQFQSIREGSICGRFLRNKQESTVEEYQNLFDKLVAP